MSRVSVHLAESLHEQASELPLYRRVRLLEGVEDSFLLLLRNANTGVGDPNYQSIVLDRRRDLDAALLGEFDRVADQVVEDLLLAVLIGVGSR